MNPPVQRQQRKRQEQEEPVRLVLGSHRRRSEDAQADVRRKRRSTADPGQCEQPEATPEEIGHVEIGGSAVVDGERRACESDRRKYPGEASGELDREPIGDHRYPDAHSRAHGPRHQGEVRDRHLWITQPPRVGRQRSRRQAAGHRQIQGVRSVHERQQREVQRRVLRPPVTAVEHLPRVAQRSERRDRVDGPITVGIRQPPRDAESVEAGEREYENPHLARPRPCVRLLRAPHRTAAGARCGPARSSSPQALGRKLAGSSVDRPARADGAATLASAMSVTIASASRHPTRGERRCMRGLRSNSDEGLNEPSA